MLNEVAGKSVVFVFFCNEITVFICVKEKKRNETNVERKNNVFGGILMKSSQVAMVIMVL